LQDFIYSDDRRFVQSAWLTHPFKIYVRKSRRWHNNRVYNTFELSNLPNDEGKLPRGAFRAFMEEVEASNFFDAIYIENVFDFLAKNGYINLARIGGCDVNGYASFIKPLKEGMAYPHLG
jgi:hypothetical protein